MLIVNTDNGIHVHYLLTTQQKSWQNNLLFQDLQIKKSGI